MSRLVLGLVAALAMTGAVSARTLEVGPGKAYDSIAAAEKDSSRGDTIRLTAGEHFDCAVIRQSGLTIEGSGKPADTLLTDKACAGKAALVLDGDNITVRNITLTRIRVPDGNGAGIRAEGGDLTVDHVRFVNNQNGILGAPEPNATIIIRDSEFLQNGVCNPACAHGVYTNALKLLHIEHSRFFETRQAHHIKSRAARTEVIDCDLEDGPDGTSSYQIELPNGGALVMRGNMIEKGPKSENHGTVVSIGAEGITQRTPEITVENNTVVIDNPYRPVFVRNLTATAAQLAGNKLQHTVIPLDGDGTVR
jgi:hypothetical protein